MRLTHYNSDDREHFAAAAEQQRAQLVAADRQRDRVRGSQQQPRRPLDDSRPLSVVQGGPWGRGTLFVGIKLKVLSHYKLLITKAILLFQCQQKLVLRPHGTPCSKAAAPPLSLMYV